MKLSLITAVSENNVIGMKDGSLPWDLQKELAYFRGVTRGKPVIMGRTTFESIIHKLGKPLPQRHSIVLTRDPQRIEKWLHDDEVRVDAVDAWEQAVALAEKDRLEEAFVIGGAQIYEMALKAHVLDRMYLTRVHLTVKFTNPDDAVFFPDVDWDEWRELEDRKQLFPVTEDNPVAFTTHVYEHAKVAQAA